jgi:hypothetical protein
MMMTHRIVLKTHPLLATHVRSVHSILFRSGLQTTKRSEGRHALHVVLRFWGRLPQPKWRSPLTR